jgi:hypothetical protein
MDVGHVDADAEGGAMEIENFRPVCHEDNLLMGTMNLFEYGLKMQVPLSNFEPWLQSYAEFKEYKRDKQLEEQPREPKSQPVAMLQPQNACASKLLSFGEIHGDRVTCYDSRDMPSSIATESGISRGDHVCLKCRGRLDRLITRVEQQVLAPLYA